MREVSCGTSVLIFPHCYSELVRSPTRFKLDLGEWRPVLNEVADVQLKDPVALTQRFGRFDVTKTNTRKINQQLLLLRVLLLTLTQNIGHFFLQRGGRPFVTYEILFTKVLPSPSFSPFLLTFHYFFKCL